MSEHTSPLFDDMYATIDSSGRQLLDEFIPQFRCHELAILNAQDKLKSLRSLFASGQRVWPIACNDAINHLTALVEHNRKFHASIQHSEHLPLVVVPLRLDLLLTLKNIELQFTKLSRLLATLRDEGSTALNQSVEERHVIVQELDVLIKYCDQVIQQAEDLQNENVVLI